MIFKGTKKYEFRRSIFKKRNVETVIVYASSPVQRVIGEFEIDTILSDYKVNSADYLDVVIYQLSIDLKSKEYVAQRRGGAEK